MAFNQDKIHKIVDFIDMNSNKVNTAKDKLTIYEGTLKPFVLAALQAELSPTAFERASKRVAPINMLTKVVNKLSTLYNNTVIRTLKEENDVDQEVMDWYVENLRLDDRGKDSNKQLNLNKYTAWEIYISEQDTTIPKLRVLPAHQFLVYSDDMEDPTNETVFIKMLGTWNKQTDEIDQDGNPIYRQVQIYKLYDNEQIIVVDSDKEIRRNFMEGNEDGVNPYGVIPFVYIRNSKYNLLPTEDTSDVPMTVLIPVLLTDLNYATQYMSHSIIYTIDADITNLSGNPDSVWNIKSDETELEEKGTTAKIGTIKPEVDIDKVIKLIQTQLALWLDSKDLKAQGVGAVEASNLASGISKMIDEADTTQAIKGQIEVYREAESSLWLKIGVMHNVWVEQGFLSGTDIDKRVSDKLKVNTIFEEPAVIVDEKSRIETIKLKEESGYTSYKAAIREANPELDEEELDALIEEIEQDQLTRQTITMENDNGTNGQDDNGAGSTSETREETKEQEAGEKQDATNEEK